MKLRSMIVAALVLTFATLCAAQFKAIAAEAAAEAWLNLVYSGDYYQSWQDASSLFKSAVTEGEWEQKLKAAHGPLGALISRKLKSADYKTKLPGAPDGEYVVILYNTSFANKKSAIETVTLMLDKDRKWRVLGYFIR